MPTQLEQAIKKSSDQYLKDLDGAEQFLTNISKQESSFGKNTNDSPTGATGVWQFLNSTWRDYDVKYRQAKDAPLEVQTDVAAKYVRDLYKRYSGDKSAVMIAYGTGDTVAKRFVKFQKDYDSFTAIKKAIEESVSSGEWDKKFANNRKHFGPDRVSGASKLLQEITPHLNHTLGTKYSAKGYAPREVGLKGQVKDSKDSLALQFFKQTTIVKKELFTDITTCLKDVNGPARLRKLLHMS